MASKIIPVIMCGGAGTRLWPALRENMPKHSFRCFRRTRCFRTRSRASEKTILREADRHHEHQLSISGGRPTRCNRSPADIVLEPVRRDSGPAVAVASLLGLQRGRTPAVGVAADHVINDIDQFHDSCVRSRAPQRRGHIVTFGVVPTEASPAYGYLSPGEEIEGSGVRKLLSFAEKPDRDKAHSYIQQGYLWNSGDCLVPRGRDDRRSSRLSAGAASGCRARGARATTGPDFIRLGETEFGQAPKISSTTQ